MKLQLALDVLSLEDALTLARAVEDQVDRFEIGTPFLLEYGMEAVRRFRECFPQKELLADTKIMDAGKLEADSAFRAGADLVTVLAVTDVATIRACVETADRVGRRVVADMICVTDLVSKVRELEEAGIHGIAVHTGVDQQAHGRTPLGDLAAIKAVARRAEVAVAGGIAQKTILDYCALRPDVLIIG
ncbi:MAG: 3-hexulose-6-phosphate synthase, partial [Lawsonibacter sp.]|nr:3-hexulose-6-phosphate synthase [Lawsonibacter sp.]